MLFRTWFFCRDDRTWKPRVSYPIDFCYVGPKHIPYANTLCRQFFWPGINCKDFLSLYSCASWYLMMIVTLVECCRNILASRIVRVHLQFIVTLHSQKATDCTSHFVTIFIYLIIRTLTAVPNTEFNVTTVTIRKWEIVWCTIKCVSHLDVIFNQFTNFALLAKLWHESW